MNINVGRGLLGSVALCIVLLSACGGEKPTPTPFTPTPSTPTAPAPGVVANATPGGRSPTLTPSTPTNAAPEVAASAEVIEAAILQLNGSALDDTLPGGALRTEWTLVRGPSRVIFADPSRVDTTATFTTAGTYVLRLTATDGEFTVSDDLTVEVQP